MIGDYEPVPSPYNVHEHDHTVQGDGRLAQRLTELTEINQPWQGSRERLRQIQDEMSLIVFEQMQRYGETHPESQSKQMEVYHE